MLVGLLQSASFPVIQFVLHCLSQVRWVQFGRPAGGPPVVCRYKIQQVLTSRPRMYSLVLFGKKGWVPTAIE